MSGKRVHDRNNDWKACSWEDHEFSPSSSSPRTFFFVPSSVEPPPHTHILLPYFSSSHASFSFLFLFTSLFLRICLIIAFSSALSLFNSSYFITFYFSFLSFSFIFIALFRSGSGKYFTVLAFPSLFWLSSFSSARDRLTECQLQRRSVSVLSK